MAVLTKNHKHFVNDNLELFRSGFVAMVLFATWGQQKLGFVGRSNLDERMAQHDGPIFLSHCGPTIAPAVVFSQFHGIIGGLGITSRLMFGVFCVVVAVVVSCARNIDVPLPFGSRSLVGLRAWAGRGGPGFPWWSGVQDGAEAVAAITGKKRCPMAEASARAVCSWDHHSSLPAGRVRFREAAASLLSTGTSNVAAPALW